jgi:hypothetical protein
MEAHITESSKQSRSGLLDRPYFNLADLTAMIRYYQGQLTRFKDYYRKETGTPWHDPVN